MRLRGPTCAMRVSPLQLGAMSIGDAWNGFMGAMDKEQSFALLDAFSALGGNMIDTANTYTNEQSETWIGEWMQARGNRDRMVLATKYTVRLVEKTVTPTRLNHKLLFRRTIVRTSMARTKASTRPETRSAHSTCLFATHLRRFSGSLVGGNA